MKRFFFRCRISQPQPQRIWTKFQQRPCASSSSSTNYSKSDLQFRASEVDWYLSLARRKAEEQNISSKAKKLAAEVEKDSFWEDVKKATKVSKELSKLNDILKRIEDLSIERENAVELGALAAETEADEGQEIIGDCCSELLLIETKARSLSTELLLDGEADDKDCLIEINAGAGGDESCDFALMILNMYQKFCNEMGFKTSIMEKQDNLVAGFKFAVLKVEGLSAYGWLRTETGIHRLVRCSPFDASGRRHTSFVQVAVIPFTENDNDIQISETDLKIETMRAGGAGGQHVNTTDSAVRITHIPTGMTANSQHERSQHLNKGRALAVLKGRLLQKKLEEERIIKQGLKNESGQANFGNQVKSYILQPYRLIKDHRTNHETGNTDSVLEGNKSGVLPFIEAALIKGL